MDGSGLYWRWSCVISLVTPPSDEGRASTGSKGGECMTDYKLTVEVLEARIAPVGMSMGGQ